MFIMDNRFTLKGGYVSSHKPLASVFPASAVFRSWISYFDFWLTFKIILEVSLGHEFGDNVDWLSDGTHSQETDEVPVTQRLERVYLLLHVTSVQVLCKSPKSTFRGIYSHLSSGNPQICCYKPCLKVLMATLSSPFQRPS